MNRKMTFIKSAVDPRDFPVLNLPEVAIAGRSNAGKSSLINLIAGSKIAKVSGTPGKTRLLNFFNMGEKYVLVDMPGYGFAARSASEIGDWQQMINTYLVGRTHLRGLILVMDIRRSWAEEEEQIKKFCGLHSLYLLVVLTKGDKLSRNDKKMAIDKVSKACKMQSVMATSSLKKEGYTEVEDYVYSQWVEPK